MSEFGGLWKHENNRQHALEPPKTECGCPSGAGIKNGHICYPSYGGTQKEKKTSNKATVELKLIPPSLVQTSIRLRVPI
jgi:hypothetical protein